jgi:hypothetical protein
MDIGEKERADDSKTPDEAKSQATTEKPRRRTKEDTKSEFPEAPKPVIGMEDERGRVRILTPIANKTRRILTDSSQSRRVRVADAQTTACC